MVQQIFGFVAALLKGIASLTGLTYYTINILVYYLLVPLSWTLMTDKILNFRVPWITIVYVLIWVVIFIATSGRFQTWCDVAFKKSVDFLQWFRCIGWDYNLASVIICVVVPIIIYGILIFLLMK